MDSAKNSAKWSNWHISLTYYKNFKSLFPKIMDGVDIEVNKEKGKQQERRNPIFHSSVSPCPSLSPIRT
jgi:hypothetical protein